MSALSQVEQIFEKYAASAEEFIRSGVITNLKEKQIVLNKEISLYYTPLSLPLR